MANQFKSNCNWNVADANGKLLGDYDWSGAQVALLMDIRRELQTLNAVFACQNFLDVPRKLDAIRKNTTKPRKRKVAK